MSPMIVLTVQVFGAPGLLLLALLGRYALILRRADKARTKKESKRRILYILSRLGVGQYMYWGDQWQNSQIT